jgi:hypothetical protein
MLSRLVLTLLLASGCALSTVGQLPRVKTVSTRGIESVIIDSVIVERMWEMMVEAAPLEGAGCFVAHLEENRTALVVDSIVPPEEIIEQGRDFITYTCDYDSKGYVGSMHTHPMIYDPGDVCRSSIQDQIDMFDNPRAILMVTLCPNDFLEIRLRDGRTWHEQYAE